MLRILFLCTGNRCRSPVAEAYLRRYSTALPFEVSSAGLLDLGPAPALPEVLRAGESIGLDLSEHRARSVELVDLERVDVVVGLERSHVAAVVVEKQVPYEKAFTFGELVRLLETIGPVEDLDPERRARKALELAHRARSAGEFMPGEDVTDPFGGARPGYASMALKLRDLSDRLLEGLFGHVPQGSAAST